MLTPTTHSAAALPTTASHCCLPSMPHHLARTLLSHLRVPSSPRRHRPLLSLPRRHRPLLQGVHFIVAEGDHHHDTTFCSSNTAPSPSTYRAYVYILLCSGYKYFNGSTCLMSLQIYPPHYYYHSRSVAAK